MSSQKAAYLNEWVIVRLEEISASKKYAFTGGPFGSNLVSSDYCSNGVPVIRGVNLPNHSSFSFEDLVFVSEDKADKLLPNNAYPGDLVFTQRGTLGQVGLIPETSPYKRFVISQSQMKLTVDETKANTHFLYYYFRLRSTVEAIQNLALSSGIPHINLDILRKFEVILPPLRTQRKIAAILTAYDDLIENNRRRIALLEQMAEAIYREWFVRLRFPGHETVPIEQGVPAGWERKNLGDILELCYGKALKEEDRIHGEFLVYGSGGIVGTHNVALVNKPGIIVGRKGNVGSIYWSDRGFFPIDTVYYVKSDLSDHYLFFLLQSMNFLNNDAAVPGLNRNQAYSNKLLLPTAFLIQEFSRIVETNFTIKQNLTKQNEILMITRDLLLPRLLSGKLAVDALDIQFPPHPPEAI
jgi:type I restriction enzyme S subunit